MRGMSSAKGPAGEVAGQGAAGGTDPAAQRGGEHRAEEPADAYPRQQQPHHGGVGPDVADEEHDEDRLVADEGEVAQRTEDGQDP